MQNAIKSGSVFVNKRVQTRPGALLNSGDLIEMEPINQSNETSDIPPIEIDLPILFEDEHLVIIDKPYAMLSHPATFAEKPVTSSTEPTVLHGLIHHCGAQVT